MANRPAPPGATPAHDCIDAIYRRDDLCVQGWAFLDGASLQRNVETGKSIPFPQIQDMSNA